VLTGWWRLQGWSSKDVMRLLGVSTRDKKKLKETMLVDFLQFADAVVEVHGDPFYELRYRCAADAPTPRGGLLTA
jgi:hypothetical protein